MTREELHEQKLEKLYGVLPSKDRSKLPEADRLWYEKRDDLARHEETLLTYDEFYKYANIIYPDEKWGASFTRKRKDGTVSHKHQIIIRTDMKRVVYFYNDVIIYTVLIDNLGDLYD